MNRARIDLNCDLGEDPARIADDDALLHIVTSANIACGGHAGDGSSMRRTVEAARANGVAVGAHPSYPDRAGFGRTAMTIAPRDLLASLVDQIQSLASIAMSCGCPVSHVKPHGALYHAAMFDETTARVVADAVATTAPRATLVGLAGAPGLAVWSSTGAPVAGEAFADRRYEPDGRLRARTLDDAVIDDPHDAAAQAVTIARDSATVAVDGSRLPVRAETICVHSDTPRAVAIARHVRDALERSGVMVTPLGRLDRPG